MSDTASHRRKYNRTPPERWEELREYVYEYFMRQRKSHEEVLRVLKKKHGVDIGLRQLKRKTSEWGFRKNKSRAEAAPQAQKRGNCSGKETKRRCRDKAVEELIGEPQGRCDVAFECDRTPSLESQSSDLSSNTACATPPTERERATNAGERTSQMTVQPIQAFNDSAERIFHRQKRDGSVTPGQATDVARPTLPKPTCACPGWSPFWDIVDGNFPAAEKRIRSLSESLRVGAGLCSLGDQYVRFHLEVVRAVRTECNSVDGLGVTTTQKLSSALTSMRQKYMDMSPAERRQLKLDRVLLQFEQTAGSFYVISYLQIRRQAHRYLLEDQNEADSHLSAYRKILAINSTLKGIRRRMGKFDSKNAPLVATGANTGQTHWTDLKNPASSAQFRHDVRRPVDNGDTLLGMPRLQDLIDTRDMGFLQREWDSLLDRIRLSLVA